MLHKSGNPPPEPVLSVVPVNCAYMVGLYKFYETDSAIYLLLQHATGGKLWTYVSAYIQQHSESLVDNIFEQQIDIKPHTSRSITPKRVTNVYAGQHLHENSPNDEPSLSIGQGHANVRREVERTTSDSRLSSATPKIADTSDLPVNPRLKNILHNDESRDFLSLDGSKDSSQIHVNEMYHESGGRQSKQTYYSMSSIDDDIVVSPAEEALPETDENTKFGELLKETVPNIENFSISSFDSDSGPCSRFDSTTSDHIESIPEVCELSPHRSCEDISCGEVFLTTNKYADSDNDIVMQAQDLIKNVDKILAEADQEVLVVTNTDTISPLVVDGDLNGAFPTSTPKKNDTELDRAIIDDIDEPSIYDLHRSTEGDNASFNGSIDTYDIDEPPENTHAAFKPKSLDFSKSKHDNVITDTNTSQVPEQNVNSLKGLKSTGSKPQVFRVQSQGLRTSGSERKPRSRNLSGVFGELDLAEDGDEGRSRRRSLVYLPEGCVRQWAAEIVVALTRLHAMGILCR